MVLLRRDKCHSIAKAVVIGAFIESISSCLQTTRCRITRPVKPSVRENSGYIEKYQRILSLFDSARITWTGRRNPHCTAHNDLRSSAIRVSELRATSQKMRGTSQESYKDPGGRDRS
jgi:hypothetical protein